MKEKNNIKKYKNNNIILFQKSKIGEIFDFGFIIKEKEGIIMKLYLISINKSKEDFKHLDKKIIEMKCALLKEKFKDYGEINKFSFGIITSLSTFKANNSNKLNQSGGYELMKKECENNNYELLVFNISNRKIFCEKLGILEEYHSLYYINQVNSLKIPNYNHFLKKNPKFLSTKFINKKYNNYIKKYLDYNDA